MTKLTVREIKNNLSIIDDLNHPMLLEYLKDERKGVRLAVKQREKQLKHQLELKKQYEEMLQIERALKQEGYQSIVGIDEVGRGPLAGPVVAAGVILKDNSTRLIGVKDSKQLTKSKREKFYHQIMETAHKVVIIEKSSKYIDEVNIYQATIDAMQSVIEALKPSVDYALIDAVPINNSIPTQSIIKGDQVSLSIASASILAKIHRDEIMTAYHSKYPEFDFASNMGYGTKQHLTALKKYGYTPIHRQSFNPVQQIKTKYCN